MSESWVNSAELGGADLPLRLPESGSRQAALTGALRDAVREGRLAPGTRLPPYRSLAADLGLARNTVASAYAELVAEGWLVARQGSGTRVAERAAPPRPVRVPKRAPVREGAEGAPRGPVHNLRQGQPEAASFPRAPWLAAARRALNAAPHEAFGPGDPQGRHELREALAEYLARARGVRTTPERIVICSGVVHALRLLFGGGVLRGPLAVESYGLTFHHGVLEESGVRTVPLALDEYGARTGELASLGRVRAALLTPAHQFPTGGPLHPERRNAAVDWARTHEGLLLEDDYDGEFRYDREPVDPTPRQLTRQQVRAHAEAPPMRHEGSARTGLRLSAAHHTAQDSAGSSSHAVCPSAVTVSPNRSNPGLPLPFHQRYAASASSHSRRGPDCHTAALSCPSWNMTHAQDRSVRPYSHTGRAPLTFTASTWTHAGTRSPSAKREGANRSVTMWLSPREVDDRSAPPTPSGT
ncbi:PLP-dependent aminotransferase family protein [Streptomyces sp. NPDC048172]|uniref:aminotransferase-like domain-containing protein n=1 Tax=Streptomyces sp. NPDC048172 TaxID=3365505 RepID=UPI00372345AF